MANYGKYGFLPAIALCLLWATEVSLGAGEARADARR